MLERIFSKVTEMSLTAQIIILIVCVMRMLLKRFPKYISYILWSVVLFRLLFPVTLESGIGIVPDLGTLFHEYILKEAALAENHGRLVAADVDESEIPYAVSETGNTQGDQIVLGTESGYIPGAGNGRETVDFMYGGYATEVPEEKIPSVETDMPERARMPESGYEAEDGNAGETEASWHRLFLSYGKYVWLAGIGILFLYCSISSAMMKNIVMESKRLKKNIYIINEMLSPFVMGIFEPRIYLPTGLSRQEQKYIILHERIHIRRLDHIVKPVAFAALCVHWFNPMVWLAYSLFCKDMEMSCDEAVVRKLGMQIRAEYSESLLRLSSQRRIIRSIPVDFGEGDTKGRIKNLAAFKQRKMWVMAVLSVGVAILIISLAFTQRVTVSGEDVPNKDMSGVDADMLGLDLNMSGMDLDMSAVGGDIAVSGNTAPLNLSLDITDFYVTHTGDGRNIYHIDENHVLWGCGRNEYGQLGQGTQDYDFHEDMVKIAENVIHVDFSQRVVVIFLTEDHKLYGMGTAGGGALQQLDEFDWMRYSNLDHYAVTTPILLMEDVVYACCGRDDIVCMKEDGTVWTWGVIYHDARSIGYPSEQGDLRFIENPQMILENAILVTGGWFNHAALLQDGTVWTWGYNSSGNCGIEGAEFIGSPTKVAEDVIMVRTDISVDGYPVPDADDISMAWTGEAKYTVDDTITEFDGSYPRYLNNTVIQKADGSYWVCGENVGTEERVVYGELADYSVICTHEFYPCE